VLVVWECALRGRGAIPFSAVLDEIETFIRGSGQAVDEMPSLSLRTRVEQW
jgi:G:T-mismatch repair DNA endonuclease (very short patch repair protein)